MQTPELAAELTALLTEMREADRMAVVFATPVIELAGLGGPKLPVGDIGQRWPPGWHSVRSRDHNRMTLGG